MGGTNEHKEVSDKVPQHNNLQISETDIYEARTQ